MPKPSPVGDELGLVYFVPNPEVDHGYADTYGVVLAVETAIAVASPLKATPVEPPLPGSVAGLAYLVPNPELDQGYTVM
jgi:hypothetical protein